MPASWWKGANLGELTVADLPVPPGFVVTADAYRYAVASAGISEALAKLFADVNVESTADLDRVSEEAQSLLRTIVLRATCRAPSWRRTTAWARRFASRFARRAPARTPATRRSRDERDVHQRLRR